jgi:hypothetical protein
MVIDQGRRMLQVRLTSSTLTLAVTCGAAYHEWECDDVPTFFRIEDEDGHILIRRKSCHSCLLLLPLFGGSRQLKVNYYYLITANWKEMLEDRTIGQSRMRGGQLRIALCYLV